MCKNQKSYQESGTAMMTDAMSIISFTNAPPRRLKAYPVGLRIKALLFAFESFINAAIKYLSEDVSGKYQKKNSTISMLIGLCFFSR